MRPEDVLFSLRGKEREAKRCFGMAMERSRGVIRLNWRVEKSGEVSRALVEQTTLNEPEVEACLNDFVAGLRYAPADTPLDASWTFVQGLGGPGVLERAKARASDRQRQRDAQRGNGPVVDPRSPGKLSVEQIENVADHGFRLYAFCMREGVNRDLQLKGQVLLQFTIDHRGKVRSISDAGSDLPDLEVIDCVAQGFYAMEFPPPSGGILRLSYSILLNEE
jgi:hypothetical protein